MNRPEKWSGIFLSDEDRELLKGLGKPGNSSQVDYTKLLERIADSLEDISETFEELLKLYKKVQKGA